MKEKVSKLKIIYFLLKYRRYGVFSKILKILGFEIPTTVKIGENLTFPHLGGNIVIHPSCEIGNDVSIYHGVTIGRNRPWEVPSRGFKGKVVIEDGVVICAGAKIIFGDEVLIIKKNTVISANSVLVNSTNENEIWGGIPARKISNRSDF